VAKTFEELQDVLHRALPMRPPKFEPGTSGREKVSAIEDYLLESAYIHAELEEALHWLTALVEHFKEQIDAMQGWEVGLPSKPRDKITRQDVLTAKRKLNPTPFEIGGDARRTRDSVLRQIARFEYDTTVISRAYSVISGA
jgi:hypothetical protein